MDHYRECFATKQYAEVAAGTGAMLYLSERFSDVEIIVKYEGSTQRYPAHSLFLKTMSDVFRQMLESGMSEGVQQRIEIIDSNASTIKQFLRFVYTGEVHSGDWREIADLLAVGHKYNVRQLVEICEKSLMDSVTLGTACYLHDLADLFQLMNLFQLTRKIILDGAFVILHSEGFENLTEKSMEFFISSSFLNAENEMSVLIAVRQWASLECARRMIPMTKTNILAIMNPLLAHIKMRRISLHKMKFIPQQMAIKYINSNPISPRIKYNVPATLRNHMASLKFVVELGVFANKHNVTQPLTCLKMTSEASLFILGFRLVGMFRQNFHFGNGNPLLILSRENNRHSEIKFDLNSVQWKCGAPIGDQVWREVVAYFPAPARLDPYTTYTFTIKYGNLIPAKWPKVRVEANHLNTEMGAVTIHTIGQCSGITEIFLLPAPIKMEACEDVPF